MATPNHSSRAHALLSASSSDRWLHCPPSALAAAGYKNETTEFAREGTLAHEVAEIYARGEQTAPGKEITQEMIDHASDYRDYIHEQIRRVDAVVMLEQRVDFSEWVPDGFGTADCIILQGDTMDVIDYKYGKGVAVSAEDNPQMKLYGLGALNEFGFAWEVEKIRLHIFQPRIGNVSVYELTADALLDWAEKVVKPTAELAAQGKGKYNAGLWCRFCPHAGRCRQLTQICTEQINAHGLRAKLPVLASFEVAEILELEPLINIWLKRVKDQALNTMLHGGEVPGHKVVAGRGSRTWADDLEAAKVLEAAGYDREQITETKLLTVAQMEKALGKKKVAELVGGHILTHSGAPVIAPATDKRPAYNPADEFDNLEEVKQ